MTQEFFDKIAPPCVVGFMILLPDPIPIPQKATWYSTTDEQVPELDGEALVAQPGVAPFPVLDGEHNFVSLRFWQMADNSPTPFVHESKLLMKAFDAMHPTGNEDPGHEYLDQELVPGDKYRTVVEAITFNSEEPSDTTAIDRCLNELMKFYRSYRVVASRPLPELTVRRLFPTVLTFRRAPEETEVTFVGTTILEDGAPPNLGGLTSEIGTDFTMFDQAAGLQSRLDRLDPLARYAECRTDAGYALHGVGSFRDTVIHLGIACEVLFDGLLGMLIWEEGTSVDEAAELFSGTITTRIKNEFHTRLGGTWRLDRGELGDWSTKVADVRNRVVHSGYRPSEAEALAAEAAADSLRDFAARRLAALGRKYPCTNVVFFGDQPVPQGVPTLNRAARSWLEVNRDSLDAKRAEHNAWREAVNTAVSRRSR
ncbi:hypothetical protein [Gordonia amicalis]|uniref:hypothetical protein n=1 Tax=Gordonia amicalis TaxID=89053 RepID=UPI0024B89120|nr:hypothetical protein [Gordonia amicalis]MDJ0454062.1 hypothetical protein [Gordonia amicalis]MDV7078962.1 hypothetical protein [Gordonia amicalis]